MHSYSSRNDSDGFVKFRSINREDFILEKQYKYLRLCGLLGIVSFLSYFVAVVFSPIAYPGYDWMSQAVSDLSASNAPSLGLWNQLSCLYGKCGIISIMAVSIYVAETKALNSLARAGIYIFAVMNWISAVGYDLFPLSESGKGMTTFSDIMHVYVVTAGVVITSIVSLVLIIIGGMKNKTNKGLAIWAIVALSMMFIGAIGTGVVPEAYFGIVERFSVFSATGFNMLLGIYMLRGF